MGTQQQKSIHPNLIKKITHDPHFLNQCTQLKPAFCTNLVLLLKTIVHNMEKLNVNQKCPKQAKAKKKPLKVVYISNPVKLIATAAQFRAVVQELTGRDSNIAEITAYQYVDLSVTDTINQEDESRRENLVGEQKVGMVSKGLADQRAELAHDEAFSSPLLENYSSLCESQNIGNGFWDY